MTDTSFPHILQGSVWHTTNHARYERIQMDRYIVANPHIPDSGRWKTGNGPETYPYVRTLGGVSLFEFISFNPVSYSKKHPLSMWRNFVPCCIQWDAALWLEIDVSALGQHYIPGEQLLARWKEENALRHTIMPLIEAASLAPISTASIRRVFECSKAEPGLRERDP